MYKKINIILLTLLLFISNKFIIKAEEESSKIDNFQKLKNAIESASQDNVETTIVISGDIEYDVSTKQAISLKENQNIVLVDDGSVASINLMGTGTNCLFNVVENSKLTIKKSETGYIDIFSQNYSDNYANKNSGVIKVQGELVVDYVDMHDHSTGSFDSGVVVVYGGKFTMNGGILHNNNLSSQMSGIVLVTHGGTFILNDGEIKDNYLKPESLWNAAVVVEPKYGKSYFEMNGGKINNNEAFSGAVLVGSMHTELFSYDWQNDMATMIMNAGEISSNNSIHAGGGVSVIGRATFTMNNGTISENSAMNGGGVGVFDFWKHYFEPYYPNLTVEDYEGLYNIPSAFTMNGGNIINNRAVQGSGDDIDNIGGCGGGVYAASNNVKLIQGNISGNYAQTQGGGVYVAARPYVTLIDNALITENEATDIGGGIWSCPTGEVELNETSDSIVFANKAMAGEDLYYEKTEEGNEIKKEKREIKPIDTSATPLLIIKNNSSKQGGGIGTNGKVIINAYVPTTPIIPTITPPATAESLEIVSEENPDNKQPFRIVQTGIN